MAEEQPKKLMMGIVFLLCGILFAFLIYLRPDLLHVPAWVAYAMAGSFAIAGLLAFTAHLNRLDLQNMLIFLFALLLFLIFGWIALGPGSRECSVRGVGGWTQHSGLACRIPSGLSMSIPILLAWAAIRGKIPRDSKDP